MLNDHEPSPRTGRGLWLAGGTLLLPLALPLSLVARQADSAAPPPPDPPRPRAPSARWRCHRLRRRLPRRRVGRRRWCRRRRRRWRHRRGHRLGRSVPDVGHRAARRRGDRRAVSGPTIRRRHHRHLRRLPGRAKTPPPPPAPTAPAGRPARALLDRRRRSGDSTVVLFDGDGTSVFSGSRHDAKEARRLRGGDSGPFLYYRIERQGLHVARSRPDRSRAARDAGTARARAATGRARATAGGAGRAAGRAGRAAGGHGRARRRGRRRGDGGDAAMTPACTRWKRRLATLDGDGRRRAPRSRPRASAVREAIDAAAPHGRRDRGEAAATVPPRCSVEAEAMRDRQRGFGDEQAASASSRRSWGGGRPSSDASSATPPMAARERIQRLLEEAAAAGQVQPVK